MITCIETCQRFNDTNEAAKHFKVSAASISNACLYVETDGARGKRSNGLRFRRSEKRISGTIIKPEDLPKINVIKPRELKILRIRKTESGEITVRIK